MASWPTVTREFARNTSRPLRSHTCYRALQSGLRMLAAQHFTMPAMSPTMTEGNIASWKVKEGKHFLQGDSFSTGDALLEIETDKAQTDVEAQDDGKMAKIMHKAGSKGIKVGTRIAVLAEINDDLSALSLPAEESASSPSPQEDPKSSIVVSKTPESQPEAPPFSKAEDYPTLEPSESLPPSTTSGKIEKQRYPLYPSIAQLLHENGLSSSEADKIPASGPKGRLLKGDVLGYLGKISSSYSSEQSMRITRLGHLDLSKVKPAPPKTKERNQAQAPKARQREVELSSTEIAVPVSLSAVLSVQKRIQATLGIDLPLSTFIARATDLANHDLPRSAAARPSADELFDDVLGLNKVGLKVSRGRYLPQITALPAKPFTEKAGPRRHPDVYDILTEENTATVSVEVDKVSLPGIRGDSGIGDSTNVFSVSAAKGEEKRASVFLERIKTFLQVEPGKLIL